MMPSLRKLIIPKNKLKNLKLRMIHWPMLVKSWQMKLKK